MEKQCDSLRWRFHLKLSNYHVVIPHFPPYFPVSATFLVVPNFPGGIIPAIAPKDGCCTSPSCACGSCEEPGGGSWLCTYTKDPEPWLFGQSDPIGNERASLDQSAPHICLSVK